MWLPYRRGRGGSSGDRGEMLMSAQGAAQRQSAMKRRAQVNCRLA